MSRDTISIHFVNAALTGVNLDKLIEVGRYICGKLHRATESKVNRAWKGPQANKV